MSEREQERIEDLERQVTVWQKTAQHWKEVAEDYRLAAEAEAALYNETVKELRDLKYEFECTMEELRSEMQNLIDDVKEP